MDEGSLIFRGFPDDPVDATLAAPMLCSAWRSQFACLQSVKPRIRRAFVAAYLCREHLGSGRLFPQYQIRLQAAWHSDRRQSDTPQASFTAL